jgi:uncharacterized protein (TIGR02266 family)
MSNTQIVPRPPRVPFVRPVHVSREDGSGAQWLLASNLSEGGLFVRTAEPPPIGTRLRLDLEARGQTLRFAEAEVIWSRPMDITRMNQGLPGFGVRFDALAADSQSLVQHLVDVGGTGRGQAKTLAFTAAEDLGAPLREPLHAPVTPIVDLLTPTEKANTGDWPMVSPVDVAAPSAPSNKVIVDFGEEPLELGVGVRAESSEPSLDRAMLEAHVGRLDDASPRFRARRGSAPATWAAGAVLLAVVVGGGAYAWRGLREAMVAEPANEPVTRVTSTPELPASPEGAGELTAANVEGDDEIDLGSPAPAAKAAPVAKPAAVAEAKPAVAPKPAAVAEAKPVAKSEPHRAEPRPTPSLARAQIALPSGAATAVAVSEQGGALQIRPELSPGASIDRVFALSSPSRLVIDLKGPAPKGTPRVEGRSGVTSVRLGSRPGGTRLVLDLSREAGPVKTTGGDITVELR